MSDPAIPSPTWQQWGYVLAPLYLFLVLWIRICITKPEPPRRGPKGVTNGDR